MSLVIPKTKQLLLLLLAQTGLRFWAYFLYPSLSKPSRLSMAWVPLLALRLNSHNWQVDKLFPHQVSFADWIAPVQQLRKSYQSQQRKGAKWRLAIKLANVLLSTAVVTLTTYDRYLPGSILSLIDLVKASFRKTEVSLILKAALAWILALPVSRTALRASSARSEGSSDQSVCHKAACH